MPKRYPLLYSRSLYVSYASVLTILLSFIFQVPIVLVGNKCDLAVDRKVPQEYGAQLSVAWGSIPYYETSARARINVDEVFYDLVRLINQQNPMRNDRAGRKKKCKIL